MAQTTLPTATRGDAWECSLTWAGTNLTGYTVVAAARLPSGESTFVLTVERTDDANGVIVVRATREQTAQWLESAVLFDVRYTIDGRDYRTPVLSVPMRGGIA